MSKDRREYYGIAPVLPSTFPTLLDGDIYDSIKSTYEVEEAWQNKFHHYTPNGSILRNYNLFEEIDIEGELTLLHITTAYEKMKQSGYLYPSGGSLGCTVYCVPLRRNGTMHNLTKFILNYEMPMSLKARGLENATKIDMLAIRVDRKSIANMDKTANGMDHLLLGNLQADAYERFIAHARISTLDQGKFELLALQKIRQNAEFLNLCCDYGLQNIPNAKFFSGMYRLIDTVGFFGYVYFETLIEYLSLYQSDTESSFLRQKGEINSNSKRLIFEIAPHLLSSFRLPTFRPTIPELVDYLRAAAHENKLVLDFDAHEFEHFMKWRFAQNVRHKVMQGRYIEGTTSFCEVRDTNASLLGHIIRTEIGIMPELKTAASLYDTSRADLIREGWNKYNVLFPYNAIIPKGEVGINPSFPDLSYKIYRTKFNAHTGEVKLGEELPISLATNLIDPRLSTLRFQEAK